MKSYLYYESSNYITANRPVRISQTESGNDAIKVMLKTTRNTVEPVMSFSETDNILELAQQPIPSDTELLPEHIEEDLAAKIPEILIFHTHPFMEVSQLVGTEGLYFANRQVFKVNAGDLIIFNAFTPHSWIINKSDTIVKNYSFITEGIIKSSYFEKFGLILNSPPDGSESEEKSVGDRENAADSVHDDFLFAFANSNFRCKHIKSGTPMHEILCSILRDIDFENSEKKIAYEYVIRSKLMEFIVYLFRHHSNIDDAQKLRANQNLTSALKFISENLHTHISLNEVAKLCFLTPQYFSSYFKKHMGVSFSYYLDSLRVEMAMKQLINTDKSILEIVEQCGFCSKSNFYRAWYSKYQISPSEIRKIK